MFIRLKTYLYYIFLHPKEKFHLLTHSTLHFFFCDKRFKWDLLDIISWLSSLWESFSNRLRIVNNWGLSSLSRLFLCENFYLMSDELVIKLNEALSIIIIKLMLLNLCQVCSQLSAETKTIQYKNILKENELSSGWNLFGFNVSSYENDIIKHFTHNFA